MPIKNSVTILSIIILMLSGCQKEAEQPQLVDSSTAQSDQYQGTDWTLKNLAGESITLSDFRGRPTLLVFWATWCPYCKKLLPGIAELNEKYESKGLKVLAVNIKEDWKPEVYWRNFGYKFDTVLEGDEVGKIYGVRGTPTIVFIAPTGKVLGVHSFSDPHHSLLDKFAQEGIGMMGKFKN